MGEAACRSGVQLLVGYTGSRTTEALSPLNQGEPLYEQLTNMHRPHVLRLSGGWTTPSVRRAQLGDAAPPRRTGSINTVTFFRSGVPIGMPDNVDLIGDPVLDNPTTSPLVQYLHAHDHRRAAGRAPAPASSRRSSIRAENALDTTGARLEGVMRDEPFYMDFSFFKNIRVNQRVNFQLRVEMFNATNVVQWGAPNTDGHQHGVRGDYREPGQRSAVGAAAVPHQLLSGRAERSRRLRPSRCTRWHDARDEVLWMF